MIGVARQLTERYAIGERIRDNGPIAWYWGQDHLSQPPLPVVLVVAQTGHPDTRQRLDLLADITRQVRHPALPRLIERMELDQRSVLVMEGYPGVPLCQAWQAPTTQTRERFAWLTQIAEMLECLHVAGVLLSELRPEQILISPYRHVFLPDLSTLIPMSPTSLNPVPASAWVAPELSEPYPLASPRCHLYTFGMLLEALLSNGATDEVRPGTYLTMHPEANPVLARLLIKTAAVDPAYRFPSRAMQSSDPTGFEELYRTLEQCRQVIDRPRLDVAGWTTTGIVRTGNEDAYTLIHRSAGRLDDFEDAALLLLADGMGGEESGEIAAALALEAISEYLLAHPPFCRLADQPVRPDPQSLTLADHLRRAMAAANERVRRAAASGQGARGMGCTVELVYVEGTQMFVAHVGDSRTYHFRNGQGTQITRDQTLVNQLVELGLITPEEAEIHPRRAVLLQAIGGQEFVDPFLYHVRLQIEDWVVVCSDGLSNVLSLEMIAEELAQSSSAESAARRLINRTNLGGSPDNATVLVLRVI
jgi:serine/threonine protein phosphatase PrpC